MVTSSRIVSSSEGVSGAATTGGVRSATTRCKRLLSSMWSVSTARRRSVSRVRLPAMTAQDEVQAVGPLGPGLFVVAVATAELIPLFPTQPLALTAGLLFGTFKASFWCHIFHDAVSRVLTQSAVPKAAHDLMASAVLDVLCPLLCDGLIRTCWPYLR